jgi:hypothetical protein
MFCNCKDCKRQRRKGKILGTRIMGFWMRGMTTGAMEYYNGPASAYVNFPKFMRGRRRKPGKLDRRLDMA